MLLGSHLDTVRNAGRYDGMLGVLAAIEVVQRLHQQGRRLAKAIGSSALAMKRAPALALPCSAVAASPAPPESWLSQCDTDGVSVARRW